MEVVIKMPLFTIIYIICSIFYAFMGTTILQYDSKNKLNRILFLLCIILSVWAAMIGLMNSATNVKTALFFRLISVVPCSLVFALMLQCIYYTATIRSSKKSSLKFIILYIPALFSIFLYLVYPVTANDMLQTSFGWVCLMPDDRSWLWENFYNMYYTLYLVVSFALVIYWRVTTKIKREQKQAAIMIISLAIVGVLGTISDVILPLYEIVYFPPMTVLFWMIAIAGVVYSVKKYRFINLNPTSFAVEIAQRMQEGLIVTDSDGVILLVNKGACELLNYKEHEVVGSSAQIIFADKTSDFKLNDCNSLESELLAKNDKKLPVLLSINETKDGFGESIGFLIIF